MHARLYFFFSISDIEQCSGSSGLYEQYCFLELPVLELLWYKALPSLKLQSDMNALQYRIQKHCTSP
jgi:hypothetical protein